MSGEHHEGFRLFDDDEVERLRGEPLRDATRKTLEQLWEDLRARYGTGGVPEGPPVEADLVQAETVALPNFEEIPQTGLWRRFVPFGVGQFANRQNAKGLAFYEREGFGRVGEATVEGIRHLRMEKRLSGDE